MKAHTELGLAAVLCFLANDPAPVHAAVAPPREAIAAADTAGGRIGESFDESIPFGSGTSYMLGMSLLEQGNPAEALPYLHHAYSLGGRDSELARGYLEALLAMGYGLDALNVLDELIVAEPDDGELRRRRVGLLLDLEQPHNALATLRDARREGWYSDDLLTLEASIHAGLRQYERALALYRQALAALPEERERIYLQMAEAVAAAGDPDQTDAFWQEACRAVPGSQPLIYGQLRHFVVSGRIEEACSRAVELDAADAARAEGQVVWQLELVDLLIGADQTDAALDILLTRRQEGAASQIEERLLLARLLASTANAPLLRQVLQETTARWPDDPRAHYFLGDVLLAGGELAAAETEFRLAVSQQPHVAEFRLGLIRLLVTRYEQQEPRDPILAAAVLDEVRLASALVPEQDGRGHLLLGYALRSLGERGSAIESFETATADRRTRMDALLNLSLCHEELKDFGAARSVLERARKEYPEEPEVANALGYYLSLRGKDLDRAEELVREALSADPENGSYLDSLGWVYFRQSRLDEAFDLLVRAANQMPANAVILEHLGRVLAAQGKKGDGLRVLRQARELGAGGEEFDDIIRGLEEELGRER